MTFQIIEAEGWYCWRFVKGDDVICVSAGSWNSEKDCRSAIAKARISMRGARFAKVEVVR